MTAKRTPHTTGTTPKRKLTNPSSGRSGQREKPDSQRARAFKIVQYLNHPETGAVLMTPAQLRSGLDHRSIKKWAWAEHNRDVKDDGSPVPPHVNLAVQCDDARLPEQLAAWFDIPVNLVKPLSGRGAFISYVRYLTHEDPNQQASGKFRYPDSSVVSNFDWRGEVDASFGNRLHVPSHLNDLTLALMRGERELWEVRETEPLIYLHNHARLKRAAEDYREVSIAAGTTMPHVQDMKLRVRTGVTLRDALLWVADHLGLEGDDDDRMWWAGNAVMGKELPVDYR